MKLWNHTQDTIVLKVPTGRGGEVETLTVPPGEACQVADGYASMAKRRGLSDAAPHSEARSSAGDPIEVPPPPASLEPELFSGMPAPRGKRG